MTPLEGCDRCILWQAGGSLHSEEMRPSDIAGKGQHHGM